MSLAPLLPNLFAVLMAILGMAFLSEPIKAAPVFYTNGEIAVVSANGLVQQRYLGGDFIFSGIPGDTVNLGDFMAGLELIFPFRDLSTGYIHSSGPASRNPDGIVHTRFITNIASTDVPSLSSLLGVNPTFIIPGETIMGFEGSFGGGDLDYNDIVFSFTNLFPGLIPDPSGFAGVRYTLQLQGHVGSAVVPVPSAIVLFASGLLGLAGMARRKRG